MMKRDNIRVSKVVQQFSRFAHKYNYYNTIQAEVARVLVCGVSEKKYSSILDVGCGSGEIYKNIVKRDIDFDQFIALDSSIEMLSLHPSGSSIYKYNLDFDAFNSYKTLDLSKENTLLISSSAIQWSKNLDDVIMHLSNQANKVHFAIFTSQTFATLHQTANLDSPIYSAQMLKEVINKYYDASFQLKHYQLKFETVRDMFKYIKKSGVSGGEKQLTYKQIKKLMLTYPLDYLEFEVLFVEATPLK